MFQNLSIQNMFINIYIYTNYIQQKNTTIKYETSKKNQKYIYKIY